MFLSKWVICRFHVNLPGCIETGGDDSDFFLRVFLEQNEVALKTQELQLNV